MEKSTENVRGQFGRGVPFLGDKEMEEMAREPPLGGKWQVIGGRKRGMLEA